MKLKTFKCNYDQIEFTFLHPICNLKKIVSVIYHAKVTRILGMCIKIYLKENIIKI